YSALEIINAVEISTGVYEQQQWPSFKGLLRTNEVNTYTIKTVRKVLNRKYTKGTVTANGSIRPLLLADFADYRPLFS
ncbi:unnamed protein product, partial [marine sediment metagenome]